MKHIPTIPKQALAALGKSLVLARKERQWRQVDLAERIGVSRHTIVKMEQGNPNIAVAVYFTATWLLKVPFITGIVTDEVESQSTLAAFLNLMQRRLPQRVVSKGEKPIDDDKK